MPTQISQARVAGAKLPPTRIFGHKLQCKHKVMTAALALPVLLGCLGLNVSYVVPYYDPGESGGGIIEGNSTVTLTLSKNDLECEPQLWRFVQATIECPDNTVALYTEWYDKQSGM